MQEVIDASMIELYAEEGVFHEQLFFFFCFFLAVFFIIMAIKKNSVKDIKVAYGNSSGFIKRRTFLVLIMRVFSFKGLI